MTMRGIGIITVCLLLLMSCSSSGNKKSKYSGKTTLSAPYELLVVTDKDWLGSDEGEVLMDLLKSDVPALPQPEANFKVISVNPSDFSNQFRGFANILIIKTGKEYKQPKLSLAKDVYAHPQKVLTLTAPNGQAVAELVLKSGDQILSVFVEAELEREYSVLLKSNSEVVKQQAEKQFGYTMLAPKDIKSVKKGENFFWASSMERDNMLNVCMYSYELNDTMDVFLMENFLLHRNAFMGKNVQGDTEKEYMTTQMMGLEGEVVSRNGVMIMEVRGLWEMTNAPMGGPFVSYTQIDSAENRVVVAEGFVFAPQTKKRDLIRELEASLRSVKKM